MDEALTELLRYDGSFAFTTWRFFNQTTKWLGKTIPAGETIIVALNAANHDPAKFSCPHQLNFNRKRNKSLSFGYANHYCPAMPLARLELEISIRAILQYLPNIELACDIKELDWINAVLTRGLHTLHLVQRPRVLDLHVVHDFRNGELGQRWEQAKCLQKGRSLED